MSRSYSQEEQKPLWTTPSARSVDDVINILNYFCVVRRKRSWSEPGKTSNRRVLSEFRCTQLHSMTPRLSSTKTCNTHIYTRVLAHTHTNENNNNKKYGFWVSSLPKQGDGDHSLPQPLHHALWCDRTAVVEPWRVRSGLWPLVTRAGCPCH